MFSWRHQAELKYQGLFNAQHSLAICNYLLSGLAKTKIVTLALKIINNKSVSKTTFTPGEFIRVNMKADKKGMSVKPLSQ